MAGIKAILERFFIDGTYNTSVITDRTPTASFAVNAGNLWQFATAYDTTNGNQIVAQVAPNLGCICNSDGGALFVGDLLGTSVLTEVTTVPANFSVTGGVVTLPPYTFAFGNDGFKDTDDYWLRASAKPWLRHIAVPALILNARNDPFMPVGSLPNAQDVSASVTLEQPAHGGHVGFARGALPPGNIGWLPQRLLTFFAQHP